MWSIFWPTTGPQLVFGGVPLNENDLLVDLTVGDFNIAHCSVLSSRLLCLLYSAMTFLDQRLGVVNGCKGGTQDPMVVLAYSWENRSLRLILPAVAVIIKILRVFMCLGCPTAGYMEDPLARLMCNEVWDREDAVSSKLPFDAILTPQGWCCMEDADSDDLITVLKNCQINIATAMEMFRLTPISDQGGEPNRFPDFGFHMPTDGSNLHVMESLGGLLIADVADEVSRPNSTFQRFRFQWFWKQEQPLILRDVKEGLVHFDVIPACAYVYMRQGLGLPKYFKKVRPSLISCKPLAFLVARADLADLTSVREIYEEENGPLCFMTKEGKLLTDLMEKVNDLAETSTSILTVLSAVLTRLHPQGYNGEGSPDRFPPQEYNREGSPDRLPPQDYNREGSERNSPERYDCSLLDVTDEEEVENQHFDLHGIDPLHVEDPVAEFDILDPLLDDDQVGSPLGPYLI